MVYHNTDGDVMYANHFKGQWRKTTLINRKRSMSCEKIFLKQVKNRLHILYSVQYNGRTMLTHYIISDNGIKPLVVDGIKGDFSVETDGDGNIIVLFYSESENKWGIRKYLPKGDLWTEFVSVDMGNECENPFLYVDTESLFHIVYQKELAVMEYCNGDKKMLGVGQRPIMFYYDGDVVSWEGITDNKVYVKRSDDTAPTVIMSGGFSRPVRYKIRHTSSYDKLKCECCMGNVINSVVRLYGTGDFFAIPQGGNCNNNSELEKLKYRISQLEILVKQLQEDKIKPLFNQNGNNGFEI